MSGGFLFILSKLGIKRTRISDHDTPDRMFSFLFEPRGVLATVTSTYGSAVEFDGEALAVEFQAIRLFASATHRLYIVAVVQLNFRRRLCFARRYFGCMARRWFGFNTR